MELKVKILNWETGFPVVVIDEASANKIGVPPGGRASIKSSSTSKEISAIVDIASNFIKEGEIGVSSEIKKILDLKKGQKIIVSLSEPPNSLELIKKKLNKTRLSEKEIREIVEDVVNNSLSGPELALFVSAVYKQGMTFKETIYLIKAILETGSKLSLKGKFIVDKHSIGGIPGNRTTPIVVSICAAAGLVMPKSSSRAITSAAGTADVIETIAKVEFSNSELKKIIKKTNAFMIWGGSLGIVPADSKIIQIEKVLNIDPEAHLLASIISKKLASGSNYILIDIPYGKTAKVDKKTAIRLKRKFEKIVKYFHKKVKVVLTDGSQPVGNGIGPELELADILKILRQEQDRPLDLEKKSFFLAGEILEMVGKAKNGKGFDMARGIVASGKAFRKFEEIIKAQKGKVRGPKISNFRKDIISLKSGKIKEIDNKGINSLARIAGCPTYKSSGLYLYKHIGGNIKKGEKILTIYSDSKIRLKQSLVFCKKYNPIKII
jgi:putative thymidine phosphorylase